MSDSENNSPEKSLFTGRMIVSFEDLAPPQLGARVVKNASGIRLVNARELQNGEQAPGIFFDKLGIALVSCDPDQVDFLTATGAKEKCILAVEPEIICHAIEGSPSFIDTEYNTWGLEATNVLSSAFDGSGIRIAVLDTGFDLTHEDFAGRKIIYSSFVPDQGVQDMHGHGTHCIGTASGPKLPQMSPRRYGIASAAEIYAGKVLGNDGSGESGWIIAGINWAVSEQCHLISMSLGSPAYKGQSYYKYYEIAARRALEQGSLIVAAAGNESNRRFNRTSPVGHPANCPSVMAVAALDSELQVAYFSNAGINQDGGEVNISAPGVGVYSSWLMSDGGYMTISGTSMATPHVAGIGALLAQAHNVRGVELWNQIVKSVKPLCASSDDVGSGLIMAP
ncbi:MAG: S8 family serine peptidase [Candidatus Melainabacteria bacterium]|nr:S8 family serine peptidase [Candidatus Melainabacteria bacterium]